MEKFVPTVWVKDITDNLKQIKYRYRQTTIIAFFERFSRKTWKIYHKFFHRAFAQNTTLKKKIKKNWIPLTTAPVQDQNDALFKKRSLKNIRNYPIYP